MTDTNTGAPRERRPVPPMGVEPPTREPARSAARQPARFFTAPEAHEKYHIPVEMMDPAYDYMWQPTVIAGQPNQRKLSEFHRSGWDFAKSSDFAELSGYGVEYPQAMVDRGLLHVVSADEPMEVDGQILLMRPKELSKAARKKDAERAYSQVENQMKRLQQAYRPADPRQPGVQRRHRPMADDGYTEEA